MSKNNFVILIPTYNEGKLIGTLLSKLKETSFPFLVINDGSTDNTLDVLSEYEVKCRTYIPNKGKGYAIRLGAKYLKDKYDYFLIIDGDGQHSLADIPLFLKMAEKDLDIALIIGNRLVNHDNMPFIRYITNVIMSKVISLVIKQKVHDTQCGMRLIRKDVFDLNLISNNFDLETEILIKADKAGLKIKNIPIRCIYCKDRVSKIKILQDTIRFFNTIRKTLCEKNTKKNI